MNGYKLSEESARTSSLATNVVLVLLSHARDILIVARGLGQESTLREEVDLVVKALLDGERLNLFDEGIVWDAMEGILDPS